MNTKPNYDIILPAKVRFDSQLLEGSKLLYGEIHALILQTGECTVFDNYFATLYNTTTRTIQRWLNQLETAGYISREIIYKENSNEIYKRFIKILDHQ